MSIESCVQSLAALAKLAASTGDAPAETREQRAQRICSELRDHVEDVAHAERIGAVELLAIMAALLGRLVRDITDRSPQVAVAVTDLVYRHTEAQRG